MSGRPTSPVVIRVPERPTGPALAALIREVHVAGALGEVVLDGDAARGWPPGPRLVLERLVETARRGGPRRPTGTARPDGEVGPSDEHDDRSA